MALVDVNYSPWNLRPAALAHERAGVALRLRIG
jgi:hypothetical protein